MATRKASKGCYNCMKRRIVCDKREPNCAKCQKKGLQCPGMGIRYRFNEGLAARGKLKGKTFNLQSPDIPTETTTSRTAVPLHLKWVACGGDNVTEKQSNSQVRCDDSTGQENSLDEVSSSGTAELSGTEGYSNCNASAGDVFQFLPLVPCVEQLDAKTRFLFNHFADYVSPVMILTDGITNGYRYQILPLAVEDAMVQRAVCVAAAFHLSIEQPQLRLPAEAGRAAIISKLKTKALIGEVVSLSTWATLILVFVGELIVGSNDILTAHKMLTSFMKLRGSTADGSGLASFCQQQTDIINFFTMPAISETDGVEQLLATSSPETGDLEWPQPPIFSRKSYSEAYRQSSAIYLLRAQSEFINLDDPIAIKLVARLKDLLIDVDPSSPGAHTLVWPYWVAACEALLEEHRLFFYQRLLHIWETTRYRNVKIAIDALESIWERRGEVRWTAMLPDIAMVIM
ncbi:uncharacterized protein PV09_04637 [Verruconis gallopava]|uniref:Zn(2)-C6 fungal-type domain-containing protein n=1 Tax=Verruconis gallopava TaxID=253628 RepID=A0A0D2ABX1_9PEZI|nr:uncharacterized protein PV09_04637 [Verruconis gallopava]KIW04348.1 hypothetical protein PV09_04637 [Verruconis gallopava]